MDIVIRGVVVYGFLFVIMRIAGNRQFSELTMFDAVLLLIIAEAAQQGLLGEDDGSVTTALVLIITLTAIDIGLSHIKHWSRRADLLLEGSPVVLFENGQFVKLHMDKERVDMEDVVAAARASHGIESLDAVKYAILERNGTISIIPKEG